MARKTSISSLKFQIVHLVGFYVLIENFMLFMFYSLNVDEIEKKSMEKEERGGSVWLAI